VNVTRCILRGPWTIDSDGEEEVGPAGYTCDSQRQGRHNAYEQQKISDQIYQPYYCRSMPMWMGRRLISKGCATLAILETRHSAPTWKVLHTKHIINPNHLQVYAIIAKCTRAQTVKAWIGEACAKLLEIQIAIDNLEIDHTTT
jgi:hypothetical protein